MLLLHSLALAGRLQGKATTYRTVRISGSGSLSADADKVYRPVLINRAGLRKTIDAALHEVIGNSINANHWASASYQPTPTIVEAARALYAQHSVEAIARFDAGAQNLHVTSKQIEKLIDEARAHKHKVIQ